MITAWDKVQLARQAERPKSLDYINNIFDTAIAYPAFPELKHS